jgi:hypothetical protein
MTWTEVKGHKGPVKRHICIGTKRAQILTCFTDYLSIKARKGTNHHTSRNNLESEGCVYLALMFLFVGVMLRTVNRDGQLVRLLTWNHTLKMSIK